MSTLFQLFSCEDEKVLTLFQLTLFRPHMKKVEKVSTLFRPHMKKVEKSVDTFSSSHEKVEKVSALFRPHMKTIWDTRDTIRDTLGYSHA